MTARIDYRTYEVYAMHTCNVRPKLPGCFDSPCPQQQQQQQLPHQKSGPIPTFSTVKPMHTLSNERLYVSHWSSSSAGEKEDTSLWRQ